MTSVDARIEDMWISLEHDTDPDASYLTDKGRWANAKDEAADRKRLKEFEAGEWMMVGVVAHADIVVDGVAQTLRSGGLWNVESDSGKAYLSEVAKEEYDSLVAILKKLGFKKIPGFKSIRWKRDY